MRVRSGFTLIELSIVIVIIGLIVGGITVGRHLTEIARLQKVMRQIESYNAATGAFRARFNALPGDMSNPAAFWRVDPDCTNGAGTRDPGQTCAGNGDGIINGRSFPDTTNYSEVFGYWNQLSLAGLIPGTYVAQGLQYGGVAAGMPDFNIPRAMDGGGIELMWADNGLATASPGITNARHIFVIGIWSFGGGSEWPSNGPTEGRLFSSNQASYIDLKIDDGMPFLGNISATYDIWYLNCADGITPTSRYVASDDINWHWTSRTGCGMYFRAAF